MGDHGKLNLGFFWFHKNIDKNKSGQGTWNWPLGVTVANKISYFGQLTGWVALGLNTLNNAYFTLLRTNLSLKRVNLRPY